MFTSAPLGINLITRTTLDRENEAWRDDRVPGGVPGVPGVPGG